MCMCNGAAVPNVAPRVESAAPVMPSNRYSLPHAVITEEWVHRISL